MKRFHRQPFHKQQGMQQLGIFSIMNTESKKIEDTLEICSKHKEKAGTPEFSNSKAIPMNTIFDPDKWKNKNSKSQAWYAAWFMKKNRTD